jgi:tryptophan halogenase
MRPIIFAQDAPAGTRNANLSASRLRQDSPSANAWREFRQPMLRPNILVLGGGSAGLIAAITFKRLVPALEVRLVRSPEIGIIGVGEGTTPVFPAHLHSYLGLPPREFYLRAQPTWKLGIRLLWGARGDFSYTFDSQLGWRWGDLARNNGFYCDADMSDIGLYSALMKRNRVFPLGASGKPEVTLTSYAYHVENLKLVSYLEWQATRLGVVITDGTVRQAGCEGENITHLELESGERIEADLYVDASGFRAKLIGEALKEPYLDYSGTLFCDRAVIGPRLRERNEPIRPYTTAETMNHGWCWRIDHEQHVNRGYVYSSAFVSDDEAEAEFRRKNPKVRDVRLVRFRSGRYRRSWVGNVVAVGNASGFVEPLEATALMVLCNQCATIVKGFLDSLGDPPPTLIRLYNDFLGRHWDETRDFLALHYRFNTMLDTPFWQHCRANTPLHGAQPLVDFYVENGPSLLAKGNRSGRAVSSAWKAITRCSWA